MNETLLNLSGIGPQLAQKFESLGIKTVSQLIDYFPRKYDDYSEVTSIKAIKPGRITIRAVIKQVTGHYVRRGLHITEAIASDETDSVRVVWFNQPYRAKAMKTNTAYFISGNYELSYRRFAVMNPAMELASDFPLQTARIVPIYRENKQINSAQIRRALAAALPTIQSLPENLPTWLTESVALVSHGQAMVGLHFPTSPEHLAAARERLAFEEVFELSLASLLRKYELLQEQAPAVPFVQAVAAQFIAKLPFKLTDDQRRTAWQIFQDMTKSQPMNRLVEGDVGAGKTLVAVLAAIMVMQHGHQVAFMAPTELLARQHAETVYKLLEPIGQSQRVGLLVGSIRKKQKDDIRQRLRDGDCQLIIGTQALIQEMVDMHNLELVIIDEQHRFGVDQRKQLQQKAGHMPHVLSMTATPIPRSLALTLYGELDVSIIEQKPAGRLPIVTKLFESTAQAALYRQVDKELAAGHQAFVVCPQISDKGDEASSAEKVYKELSTGTFKHRRVGLLHGKLKADEKTAIMRQFVSHELDLLVSTTVIEVGVDIPNATVMVITAAERFGLAQMHQLRGRVGRGADQAYCYLLLGKGVAPSRRLRALEQSNNGFELAELDLELRGPGAIYGTLQHGALDLRIATLSDSRLIAAARQAAQQFIDRGEDLLQYHELAQKTNRLQAVTNLN